jgi:hypothetical protein
MPHIDKVAGQGARGEEDDVDADIIAILHISGRENFGSGGHAAQAIIVNCMVELGDRRAIFDFDKSDNAGATRDKIDFTRRRADAHVENFPALQPQPCRGKSFGAAAAGFGGLTFHVFSTTARA